MVEYHIPLWLTGEGLYKDPYGPENGFVKLPDAPGLGLEPNKEGLKEFLEP
jgi:L-alanine-DL-glutamate epimerase-like enolase superfamily enzyme